MCTPEVFKKSCCIAGCVSQVFLLLLSASFYLPFLWKLDTSSERFTGGIWTYCEEKQGWECYKVTEDLVEHWGQTWSNYYTMRTFIPLGEMVGVCTWVLFYISICVNSTFVNILTVAGSSSQLVLLFICASLAQNTFTTFRDMSTNAAWGLYTVWAAAATALVNLMFALSALIAACLFSS